MKTHYFALYLLILSTNIAANPTLAGTSIPDATIDARDLPVGPGPSCTAITSYTGNTANVTITSPKGVVIGGDPKIQLPRSGWYNLDSRLPWTISMTLQRDGLLLQYSNDQPWTVPPQVTSRTPFDCRQFKLWLITNFWAFEEQSRWHQGTLNWTMVALDGTKLGGSPQTDLLAQALGDDYPAAILTSKLDEVVEVFWSMNNEMTFKYASQTVSLPNATGAHATMLVGSAPMGVFTWTTSGIL